MADTVELMRKRVLNMGLSGELTSSDISTWEEISLGDVCKLTNGERKSEGDNIYLHVRFLRGTANEEKRSKGNFVKKDDLVILVDGENSGEIFQLPFDGYMGSTFRKIEYSEEIDTRFLKLFIRSHQELLRNNKTGSAIPHLNKKLFASLAISLPPVAEQKRIVAKIEEIFAVIDQIGTKKEEALSIIRNMRQTALQDAIMGVLVDQDENDEPASKLIQKIKSSKRKLIDFGERKKATKVEKITENLLNYEIPPSWEWVRVNELVEINLGFTYRPTYQEDGKLFLSVKDLTDTGIDLKNAKYISNEEYEKASYGSKPKKGDLLFGRVGTLGKPRLVDFEEEFCIFVSLGFFRSYDELNVNMYYLSYWMESQLFRQQVSMFVKGSAQQNLNTGWLKNFLIPLPPLSEQRRIVQKLDEIMAICNQMEAIFDGSSEKNKALKVAE